MTDEILPIYQESRFLNQEIPQQPTLRYVRSSTNDNDQRPHYTIEFVENSVTLGENTSMSSTPRNSKVIIQNGITAGLEIEGEEITEEELIKAIAGKLLRWRVVHDASIKTDVYTNKQFRIKSEQNKVFNNAGIKNFNKITVGAELVSPILDTEDEENLLKEIILATGILQNLGEPEKGLRSGIHVHVSLSNPDLSILKSLLILGGYLESCIYHFSGMGYEFRGVKNDFTYCRPITNFGPSCVPISERTYAQCFNLNDLLESKGIYEFWEKYGDMHNSSENKYNPVRYTWLNLFPLYQGQHMKGTVELRSFNKTLNPRFILSAIKFSKKFVELAVKMSFISGLKEEFSHQHSVFNSYSKGELIEQFLHFANRSELDEETVRIISLLIEKSSSTMAENNYVHTHIRLGNYYWRGTNYTPSSINSNLISKPKYVDLHVLRGEV